MRPVHGAVIAAKSSGELTVRRTANARTSTSGRTVQILQAAPKSWAPRHNVADERDLGWQRERARELQTLERDARLWPIFRSGRRRLRHGEHALQARDDSPAEASGPKALDDLARRPYSRGTVRSSTGWARIGSARSARGQTGQLEGTRASGALHRGIERLAPPMIAWSCTIFECRAVRDPRARNVRSLRWHEPCPDAPHAHDPECLRAFSHAPCPLGL